MLMLSEWTGIGLSKSRSNMLFFFPDKSRSNMLYALHSHFSMADTSNFQKISNHQ